jgi:hypothetical protein
MLGLPASVRRFARFFEGVPGVAMRALTQPFWTDAATLYASENRFNFCHVLV